ncbi:hypothetical protein Nepgr_000830 [Nepenthes gracilis]|uniref:Uncharacterized protein n=1 Tax=Nepenthes gracilis TaxID=150966 RepID=A0AAD3P3H5_NEPGR|nr:hypothetical protein Nepgr_000830 [Nepenthes gracilis]
MIITPITISLKHHPFSRSSTLESRRDRFLASAKKNAERHRHFQVNPKNIGLDGGAKAERSLQVRQPLKQSAAPTPRGRGPNDDVDEAEDVGADAELQRVSGAGRRCRRRVYGGGSRWHGASGVAAAGVADGCAEEEGEDEKGGAVVVVGGHCLGGGVDALV